MTVLLRLSLLSALFLLPPGAGPVAAATGTAAPATTTADYAASFALEFAKDAPRRFRLSAARPNPFVASTRLELSVDEATTLTVAAFDALGRQVALLHEGVLQAGTYALTLDGSRLPPGLYLVRASDGRGNTATRSVSLVR
ncbi:MAG: T9SS type A sorting domain-containing protein [Rubricoccaceae bacterium]